MTLRKRTAVVGRAGLVRAACRAVGIGVLAAWPATSVAVSTWKASAATGDWTVDGNWVEGVAPGYYTDAQFPNAGAYTITFGASAQARFLTLSAGDVAFALGKNTLATAEVKVTGTSAALRLTGTGGSMTSLDLAVGGAGGIGSLAVGGGATYTPQNVYLGTNGGDGTGIVSNGGQINAKGLNVGSQGGTGRFTVDTGTLKLTGTGSLTVGTGRSSSATGPGSDGTLDVKNNARVSGYMMDIGRLGGVGRVTVDGPGSSLALTSGLTVGQLRDDLTATLTGDGTLNVSGGASFTASQASVGYYAGVGRVVVQGAGSRLGITNGLFVGQSRDGTIAGDGSLTARDGGVVTTSFTYIGLAGGTGRLNLDGPGSGLNTLSLDIGRDTWNGLPANGQVTLSRGAILNSNTGTGTAAVIGSGLGSGVMTVASITNDVSRWTHTGNINVGRRPVVGTNAPAKLGSGLLTIGGGGQVDISGKLTIFTPPTPDAIGGKVVVDGGTLRVGSLDIDGPGGVELRGGTIAVLYADVSPADAVRSLLAGARVYTSSAAAGAKLGYTDDGSTQVVIKPTLGGDADLDGGVSINDFNAMAGVFGRATGMHWTDGDFDYDGGISINDFNLLAANFGQSLGGAAAVDYSGLLAFAAAHNDLVAFEAVSGVPEPAGLAAAAVGGALLARRWRRAGGRPNPADFS